MEMDYFQIIPLLALTAYFFYLTYYYAAPMFFLKVLLFYAHIRYRGVEIRFEDAKIAVKMLEEEKSFERPLEIDPTSRFFAMTVFTEFKGLLRDIRKKPETDAKEDANYGVSAGKRTCGTRRPGTEKDCD